MITLKTDIVLEIAQYLDIQDLFSLAYSCSVAFRASEFYSFWRPHAHHAYNELSTFLPTTEIKPWRSYSGNDLRLSVKRLYTYKRNWMSEKPQAKFRVEAKANGFSLQSVPGSRWLYGSSDCETESDGFLVFLDGRTGLSTEKGIEVTPPGTTYQVESAIAHSLKPNEILVGASGNDKDGKCSTALFHVTFFLDKKDGSEFLGFHRKEIHVWNNHHSNPQATINSQFLALSTEISDSEAYELKIHHIWSGRTLAFFEITRNPTPFLIDNWCFLALEDSHEGTQVVSIHLPTLLESNVILKQLEPPNQEGAIIDVNFTRSCRASVLRYRCFGHSLDDREYTIIVFGPHLNHTFNVRMEFVPNSLYGHFIKTSEKQVRPDGHSLGYLITPHSIMHRFGAYDEEYYRLSPVYHGSWMVAGESTGWQNNREVYYAASTDPGIQPRAIDWNPSRWCPPRTSESNGPELVIHDLFVEYWDPWAGFVVLKDRKRGPNIVSQICWF